MKTIDYKHIIDLVLQKERARMPQEYRSMAFICMELYSDTSGAFYLYIGTGKKQGLFTFLNTEDLKKKLGVYFKPNLKESLKATPRRDKIVAYFYNRGNKVQKSLNWAILPFYLRLGKFELAMYAMDKDWRSLRVKISKNNLIKWVIKEGVY